MKKLIVLATTLTIALIFASPVKADSRPCGKPYPHIGAGTFVQVCPLWRAMYRSTMTSDPESRGI
jgi:hypothetical protein